jgi:O-Antigen ligase
MTSWLFRVVQGQPILAPVFLPAARISFVEVLAGFLVALILLVGRWTPARLFEDTGAGEVIEPRLILIAVLAVLAIISISCTRHHPKLLAARACSLRSLLLIHLLLGYMCLSVMWSQDDFDYGVKLYETSLTATVMLAIHVIGVSGNIEVVLMATLGLFSAGMATLATVGFAAFDGSRLALLGGGPNVLARNLAIFIPALLIVLKPKGLVRIGIACGLLSAALILIIASGSRGAALSFFVAFLFYLLKSHRELPTNILRLACVGCLGMIALVASGRADVIASQFEQRIVNRTIKTQYASGRDEIYADAWNVGWEYLPFGAGLNGFSVSGNDHVYPHNLPLEIFSEGGVPGIVFLVLIAYVIFSDCLRPLYQNERFLVCISIILFTSAQFSGDLYDSRCFFILSFLSHAAIQQRRVFHRWFPSKTTDSARRPGRNSPAHTGARSLFPASPRQRLAATR